MRDYTEAHIVQSVFANHQIELLPWPAHSPDLSLIENMWSMVAQRFTYITPLAATPDQLCIYHSAKNTWKHSTRLKRSSTLQLDSEIRKELNLEHSSLEFLQEPLIPKNPPKNTCFELELLRPCSKNEDPATLRQKGLETIEILSQDNFAKSPTPMVPQTDPSAMEVPESSSFSQMLRNLTVPRIMTSTIVRWRTEHLKGMKIHPDKTRSYLQCKHWPDLQLTPNHILECPNIATKLLKMGIVPLRDSLREILYSHDAPRIAEAVIKTFDGI
ncbi:hypothetical protein TNCV_4262641 [Trichonephila clavipes]|nr:hypothetical protein TNCV_4262641 [Trichonephila clavipes]